MVIQEERGKESLTNDGPGAETTSEERGRISRVMTHEEMKAELDRRVELMRAGGVDGQDSDQHRS